jgi:hypothetical protein
VLQSKYFEEENVKERERERGLQPSKGRRRRRSQLTADT